MWVALGMLLCCSWISCSVIEPGEIIKLRVIPESSFYAYHKIQPVSEQEDCFTSTIKGTIELTKILSIRREEILLEKLPKFVEIVLDKNSNSDSFEHWKRESWIKNGLLHILSNLIPCSSSTHSLASVVGTKNALVISDQVDRNDEWSLPQFFQVYLSYEYTKSNNIAVYDISTDCQYKDWHPYPKLILKEKYCPELMNAYANIMWIPSGWRNQFVTEWIPSSLVPSIDRFNLFYIPSAYKAIQESFRNSNIMTLARGSLGKRNDEEWKIHLELRDAVFTTCQIESELDGCIYDALFHGSIPIILESGVHHWRQALGPLPFPIVDNSKEAINILQYSLSHFEEVRELQQNTIKWFDQQLYIIQRNILKQWFY